MIANPQNIAYASNRSQSAKYSPCKSRNICRAPNVWRSGTCQYQDNSGFEGIGPYPGQRIHSNNQNSIRQKIQLANRLERTQRDARRDPDTARDIRNGHGSMKYSTVNPTTKQRKPGKIVRLPM